MESTRVERRGGLGRQKERAGHILVELAVSSGVGGERDDLVVIGLADLGGVGRVKIIVRHCGHLLATNFYSRRLDGA